MRNHDREQEVWLVYRKAARGKTDIDYELGRGSLMLWLDTCTGASKVSPSYRRNYILWLSDTKKQERFERRLQIMIEEVLAGKPTSVH